MLTAEHLLCEGVTWFAKSSMILQLYIQVLVYVQYLKSQESFLNDMGDMGAEVCGLSSVEYLVDGIVM